MFDSACRRIVAVLLVAVGIAGDGRSVALPVEEKPVSPAQTLHEFRTPVHEWLARGVDQKTLAANRAYADLILAFGQARAGEPDEAKRLLGEATAVLEKGDAAHRTLAALFRHRVEQVLNGKPPAGPIPADHLAAVTPSGDRGADAPARLQQYVVLRARELSRILDPLEQVDPYLSWTAEGARDPIMDSLRRLQNEQNPERFRRDAQQLLQDVGAKPTEVRLRVTEGLLRIASRAGDPFCAELLKGVPAEARAGRQESGPSARARVVTLVDQSLQVASNLQRPELFGPLVAEAVELVKTEQGDSGPAAVAALTVRCERGFRIMKLRSQADRFLKDVAGRLPETPDTATLRAAGKNWPEIARTKLAEAGIRRVAGQDDEAGRLTGVVRNAVLDPPAGPLGVAYYRLVAEYAAACGRSPEAKPRLQELLLKLGRVPDTYTTASHYSRYHWMILEAAVLGLTGADG